MFQYLILWMILFASIGHADLVDYWNGQKRGTNLFDKNDPFDANALREKFKAVRRMNLDFVRMTPSKWKSAMPDAKEGDFLIGPQHAYQGLYKPDLERLIQVLDIAQEENVKVVLVFLNIPGRRWRQHTANFVQEQKIWESFAAQDQAIAFFDDLIPHIRGHEALAAINPLNEPNPEDAKLRYSGETDKSYDAWYQKIKDSPQDINRFYARLVERIRHWTADLPIILDVGQFAAPEAFHIFKPIIDPAVLYSFHMYEPFRLTFKRVDAGYPGFVPYKLNPHYGETWTVDTLLSTLNRVKKWQERNKVSLSRIVVGEFGIFRDVPGAVNYMTDLVKIFDDNSWHHAFYSFREDNWRVMDMDPSRVIYRPMNYELGIGPASLLYEEARKLGIEPNYRLMPASPFNEILSKKPSPHERKSPLMGWNSWNSFGKKGINQTLIEEVIIALDKSGLKEAGYDFVVVDGGWRSAGLAKNGELLADPVRFSKGMKHLSDKAHAAGLKFGLHIVAGTHDCGMDPVGSFGKEELHAQQLVSWGVDFIKLDACVYKNTINWPLDLLHNTVLKWRRALDRLPGGKDVIFQINAMKAQEWYREIAISGRTTEDIRPKIFGGAIFDSLFTGEFLSVMDVAEKNNRAQALAGHGFWNDADMLVVGDSNLSHDEQKTHFALWSLMTSPLMLGNDPRTMSTAEKTLLLNRAIIAINQDPTEQGYRIEKTATVEYWRKRLSDGSSAILVINRGKEPKEIKVTQKMALIPGKFEVIDLYEQKAIGGKSREFTARLPGGESFFLQIQLAKASSILEK